MHDIMQSLWQLASNPTFAGIVSASVLGAGMWALREVPVSIWHGLLHIVSRDVTIRNDNLGFDWTERWMAETKYMQSRWLRTMRLTVRAAETIENEDYERVIAPGSGYHLLWHKRRPIVVHRWFDEGSTATTMWGKRLESIQIRMFFGSRAKLLSIIDEAQELAKFIPGRIPLYLWAHGYWNKAPALRPRSMSTVYLPEGELEGIANDVKWFCGATDWFGERGIPYRRGYLFSGPPGTGKTTLAIALASLLRRPVYVVPIAGIENDTELLGAIMSVPREAILLFEDIDTVHASADREGDEQVKKLRVGDIEIKEPKPKVNGITLGGLLNGIDGVFSSEGRILIMTTNYPDKLDPALVRPGRVDFNVHFDYADHTMLASMFNTFYQGRYKPDNFDGITPLSPATVQTLLMKHRDAPEIALEAIRTVAQMRDDAVESAEEEGQAA